MEPSKAYAITKMIKSWASTAQKIYEQFISTGKYYNDFMENDETECRKDILKLSSVVKEISGIQVSKMTLQDYVEYVMEGRDMYAINSINSMDLSEVIHINDECARIYKEVHGAPGEGVKYIFEDIQEIVLMLMSLREWVIGYVGDSAVSVITKVEAQEENVDCSESVYPSCKLNQKQSGDLVNLSDSLERYMMSQGYQIPDDMILYEVFNSCVDKRCFKPLMDLGLSQNNTFKVINLINKYILDDLQWKREVAKNHGCSLAVISGRTAPFDWKPKRKSFN